MRCFNPRSYERSDFYASRKITAFSVFQSTLLRKERLRAWRNSDLQRSFQSTLLRKERRGISKESGNCCMFQSTLLRKERPLVQYCELREEIVSIHAPTKGATPSTNITGWLRTFQSTLLRKERPPGLILGLLTLLFQSTLLRKERPE